MVKLKNLNEIRYYGDFNNEKYRFGEEDLQELFFEEGDLESIRTREEAYAFFDELNRILSKLDRSAKVKVNPRFLVSQAKRAWRVAEDIANKRNKEAEGMDDARVEFWAEPGIKYRENSGLEIGVYDDVGNYDPIASWDIEF